MAARRWRDLRVRGGRRADIAEIDLARPLREELDVAVEENQLVIRGRQTDDKTRVYLHRGIAARQFQRTFLLAEGMEVTGADLSNGLLSIDLARPEAARIVRRITIG